MSSATWRVEARSKGKKKTANHNQEKLPFRMQIRFCSRGFPPEPTRIGFTSQARGTPTILRSLHSRQTIGAPSAGQTRFAWHRKSGRPGIECKSNGSRTANFSMDGHMLGRSHSELKTRLSPGLGALPAKPPSSLRQAGWLVHCRRVDTRGRRVAGIGAQPAHLGVGLVGRADELHSGEARQIRHAEGARIRDRNGRLTQQARAPSEIATGPNGEQGKWSIREMV